MSFTIEDQRLYRKVKNRDKFAIVEWREEKYKKIRESDELVTHMELVMKYRNLTISEATRYYRSAREVDLISPVNECITALEQQGIEVSLENLRRSSKYMNAKRNIISELTTRLKVCPCCGSHSNNMVWFMKEYFISLGFLKLCRICCNAYSEPTSKTCISVYYLEFLRCMKEQQNDTALAFKIFDPYIKRGLIFDEADKEQQIKADLYMEQVQNKLRNAITKRKKKHGQ